MKVKAVYNFSWSAPWPPEVGKRSSYREAKPRSVNGCTWLPEKLSHDHLDGLSNFFKVMVLLLEWYQHYLKRTLPVRFGGFL